MCILVVCPIEHQLSDEPQNASYDKIQFTSGTFYLVIIFHTIGYRKITKLYTLHKSQAETNKKNY